MCQIGAENERELDRGKMCPTDHRRDLHRATLGGKLSDVNALQLPGRVWPLKFAQCTQDAI